MAVVLWLCDVERIHFLPFYILIIKKIVSSTCFSSPPFSTLASIYTEKENYSETLNLKKRKNKIPNMRLSSCINLLCMRLYDTYNGTS